jgi:flavin reductase
MRNTANCVAVVATDGVGGRLGITVSSMVSVSAEPPMLLVCINRNSPACGAVRRNERFSISVLSHQQSELADRFAGRGERPYTFDDDAWEFGPQPAVKGAAALFGCDLVESMDAGTHSILVGRVRYASDGNQEPLCFSNGEYARLGGLPEIGTDSVLESDGTPSRLTIVRSRKWRMS